MSKKLISMLLLALTLGTVLAGCSGGGEAAPAEGEKPAEGTAATDAEKPAEETK